MRGPTRANSVPTIRPGTTSSTRRRRRSRTGSPPPPAGDPRAGSAAPWGRAGPARCAPPTDEALEHAGVEGQSQGGRAEEEDAGDGLQTQMVHGDLGVEGALEGIETEDHQRGTMTRAGSIRAVRHAMDISSTGCSSWRGGLVRRCRAAPLGLGSVPSAATIRPAGIARRRLMRERTRRRRSRRAPGRDRRAPSAHPDGGGPVMTVPSGASNPISVNPASANSARMAGVASGARRCRVQMTLPPGRRTPASPGWCA